MLLVILTVKEYLEGFAKKELEKTNQTECRITKLIKRKDYKL